MKRAITMVALLGWLPISVAGESETRTAALVLVKQPDVSIPKRVENFLTMKFGLSSTGKIQVIGRYRLTEDSKLGQKSDEVLHVIQQDLLGSRLFWSCLVNLTRDRVQVLYQCQKPDGFGTIVTIGKEE